MKVLHAKTFPHHLVHWGAISLLAVGCTNQPPPAANRQAIPVKLQTLSAATLIDSSEFVGTLQAKKFVNLAPKINGRILRIYVQPGVAVRQGQPIIQLEPEQQQEDVNAAVGNLNIQRSNLDKAEADLRTNEAQRDAAQAAIANAEAAIATAIANAANSREVVKTREADLRRSQASLNLSQTNLKRSRFLVKNGVQPQQDLDDKTTAYEDARATVDAAQKTVDAALASARASQASVDASRAALLQARQNLKAAEQRVAAARATVNSQRAAIAQAQGQLGSVNQTLVFNTVTAPINGFVGNFDTLKIGDVVNVGQVITTITDNQTFDLNVNIPTENQKRLRVGLPVEIINADGSAGTRGSISYLSSLVDPNAQSILVKMTFQNDGSLRNNQYVRARIIWNERPGILIPTTAVSSLGSQKFVFVAQKGTEKENAELVARQTPITVGNIQGQSYQVISGVKAGDRIATDRILDLKDGRPIVDANKISQQSKAEL